MSTETIAAIATPPGQGGVGIIRLSGPLAYPIALHISQKKQITPRHAHYGSFYNQQGELIDYGLTLFFKAPNSFTGEDVVEFQAHGSPVLLDYLLKECLALGARMARPGEFSERAFVNDKMDLAQAEAVADLIQASSLTAARMAVRSLQGDFSAKINELSEKLIYLRLFVEAAIDFPEEEIDFLNDGKVAALLDDALQTLLNIRATATQGALLREGLSVVIAGKPNAGKSTLINCLAGRDVAIVTDVAGTTRDVMREQILLDDLPIHIIDTAGLRESDDRVEQEGIKRAWQEVSRADCVLMIIDVTALGEIDVLSQSIQQRLPEGVPLIRVFNKMDVLSGEQERSADAVYLSAKTGQGLEQLKERIKTVVGYHPAEGQFLARRRHLSALDQARDLLLNGQHQLMTCRAGELLAEDLRLAHMALTEITGEFSSDDLLGRIFSSFCIGK
ncbi:tRNA uridine-5-carboxymethylaminomethyl(34) synthesis GTPase MnmE [Legionella sp. CNM-4043-24]|uniref:tRNA uridine-5-carboxymethylaminomethyl(34) synthesis GTPase MnmE n=1 Tax=Legionella sp. CNM-4043-24 TaxID=3421646 RepID=UPI00403B3168